MKKNISYLLFCLILFLSFAYKVNASDYKIYIDNPSTDVVSRNKLCVEGWVMSDISDSYVVVSVDDKKYDNVTRKKRDDVLMAINGYGGAKINPTPGFSICIDLNEFLIGNHVLYIKLYSKENKLIGSLKKNIVIDSSLIKSFIDYPTNSSIFGDKVILKGWVMSTKSSLTTKVYIDDQLIDVNLIRYKREDVLRAIKGYGDEAINPTPGFSAEIPTFNLLDGNHVIRIDYLDSDEVIGSINKEFQIKKNYARVTIDSPSGIVKENKLSISGWLMSTSSNVNLKFYIDDSLINFNYSRCKREDVLTVVKGFGDEEINPNPGFVGMFDSGTLKDGNHVIKVEVISDDNQIISSYSRKFKLHKYESSMRIDAPVNNMNFKGANLTIDGWAMSEDKIKIYIDDKEVETEVSKYERPDVLKVYPNSYGGKSLNPIPGYKSIIDVSNYKDGNHKIRVELVSSKTNEILSQVTRNIVLKKYESSMRIDAPVNNMNFKGANLTIDGWFNISRLSN